MSGVDGILLVDKPAGPTSHDVVQWVRWSLRVRSVGHCGTLDPAATGLLVICLGGATKLVEYLTGVDKAYEARFVLGVATDSGDRDGEVIARAEVTRETRERAPQVLRDMCGTLMLPPPALSAIKVDGRRAHERARAGEALELEPREMRLLEVVDLGVAGTDDAGQPYFDAAVHVSKGTYVRSLATELGARLGVPVHLGALHRTRSGAASLDEPRAVSDLVATAGERGWRTRPPDIDDRDGCGAFLREHVLHPAPLLPFGSRPLEEPLIRRMAQGQRLSAREPAFAGLLEAGETHVALHGDPGPPELLVIGRVERTGPSEGRIAPEKVLKMPDLPPQKGPSA